MFYRQGSISIDRYTYLAVKELNQTMLNLNRNECRLIILTNKKIKGEWGKLDWGK